MKDKEKKSGGPQKRKAGDPPAPAPPLEKKGRGRPKTSLNPKPSGKKKGDTLQYQKRIASGNQKIDNMFKSAAAAAIKPDDPE